MRRMHLVELEDLPWFPAVLRDGGTAFLDFAERTSGHAGMLAPVLIRALDATGAPCILDLCSGAGGPARSVAAALRDAGRSLPIELSDRYPNAAAFAHAEAVSGGLVRGRLEPVDATAVPDHLEGFRTIFNAFHHFPPELARKVLTDAVRARRPIGVFEVVGREPLMLLAMLITPLTVTLSVPFWRPWRWSWLLWTWVVPVMQAFVLWDGVVSWLRIYGEDELRELVAGIDAPDWEWEIGRTRLGSAPAHATWLIGRPRGPSAPAAAR